MAQDPEITPLWLARIIYDVMRRHEPNAVVVGRPSETDYGKTFDAELGMPINNSTTIDGEFDLIAVATDIIAVIEGSR